MSDLEQMMKVGAACQKAVEDLIVKGGPRKYGIRPLDDGYQFLVRSSETKFLHPLPQEMTYNSGDKQYKVQIIHQRV